MRKNAQSGVNAAVLVAIIAALIILYIIFLPTAEREKLIEDRTSKTSREEETSNVLIKASPGLLSTSNNLEAEKSIPNVFLVETTNAKELETINPFIVKSSWFDKKTKGIDFELPDYENVDKVVVSFTAKRRDGILTIKLNGATIFENELASNVIGPVKLGKKFLGKTNSLEFSVSSVGYRFWTTNEYELENIKIIGDITDTSKQQSTNIFTLSESEYSSMDSAVLRFIPYCGNVNDLGTLDIFVNSKKLFSTVPVCENAYKQSISKSTLNEGENNIIFKTNKGSYSVEQIKVSLNFKEPKIRTYFFELNNTIFKKIRDGDKDLMLIIKFVDDKKQKSLKLDVNGHIETVETEKASFSKNINSKVENGNNFVRLEPLEDVEIAELRVELV